ncbi:MAG: hypothetical protein DHS20C14_03660 [Phycisphaeraceae bacterium]|nr:MAG: hypothetical protein DHS20C14_03660 [Phycisphaeraceae bacterium]
MHGFTAALGTLVAGVSASAGVAADDAARITETMRRFDAVETSVAWPGFETASVPLMLYDGQRTWLRGVDAWPEGFTPVGEIAVYEGRHPAHRSNTAADLDNTWIATFELHPDAQPDAFLRLMVHESFHVHQNRSLSAHAAANEASLFTFPTTDGEELGARRLEVEALERALDARDDAGRRAWGARFVSLRRGRQEHLSDAEAEYERAMERKEGICDYAAWRSVSPGERPGVGARARAPDGMRDRAYWTGLAMGQLLDALRPGWQGEMVADGRLYLDGLVAGAVAGVEPAAFDEEAERHVRAHAMEDAAAEGERRAALGEDFLRAPGWRIEILADAPLWPAGFDPLNVVSLGGGRVLHTRFVRLANDTCEIETFDRRALSEGAGEHPLFNGVSHVVITGLAEPTLERAGTVTTIVGEGVRVRAPSTAVEVADHIIRVELGG